MNSKPASGWSVWKKALVISTTFIPIAASADVGNVAGDSGATTYASAERQDAAVGHYARARALLVEALAEFEQARSVARPDLLLDPEDWRLTIISKTEELNRLLDPQPRVTRSGVRFKANQALIRTDRSSRASLGGAQDSNYAGEAQIEKELGLYKQSKEPALDEAARKAIPPAIQPAAPRDSAATIEIPKLENHPEAAKAKVLVSPKEEKEMSDTLTKIDDLKKPSEKPEKPTEAPASEEVEAAAEASKLREKLRAAQKEEQNAAEPDQSDLNTTTNSKSDPLLEDAVKTKDDAQKVSKKISSTDKENLEMSKAIEDAIRARLKKVSSMAEPVAGAPAADVKATEGKIE